jgi:emp24/gp25L/p24 family/GOLD
MNRKIEVCFFMLILSAALCFAARTGKLMLNDELEVKRGAFKEVHFLIPEGGSEIRGSFKTTGGMNDDITFIVLSQENYVRWLSGYPHKAVHKAEKKKEGKFVIPVKSGDTYYFVMDNFFSSVSNKKVKLRLDLILERK